MEAEKVSALQALRRDLELEAAEALAAALAVLKAQLEADKAAALLELRAVRPDLA